MTPFLSAQTRQLIEDRMKRGGYASPDDVVAAALASLDQHERFGDFEPGELDRLLAEGEADGDFLDGAEALAARRRRRGAKDAEPPARSA
jgi:Arc/MetJ-type ribon-helix-helix transcriptional regulator